MVTNTLSFDEDISCHNSMPPSRTTCHARRRRMVHLSGVFLNLHLARMCDYHDGDEILACLQILCTG